MGSKDHQRPWMMSEEFGPHLASGNGTGRTHAADRRPENDPDRAHNWKWAIFYLAVGVLLFLANQLAKHPTPHAGEPGAAVNVRLDLSISRKSEPPPIENASMTVATYVIRFRLTNRGNWPVFYPLDPTTNRPIGHVVHRAAPGSEWILETPTSISDGPNTPTHVSWIEMPPGGWVDGIYDDPGLPAGDHAYELQLKTSSGYKLTRILSQPYRVNPN